MIDLEARRASAWFKRMALFCDDVRFAFPRQDFVLEISGQRAKVDNDYFGPLPRAENDNAL